MMHDRREDRSTTRGTSLPGAISPMAEAFCREVLAARAPATLPDAGEGRDEVLDLLRAHRLLGLWLAERPECVDDDVDVGVRALAALQAVRTDETMAAARRAMDALRAAGCEVLLFKGAALLRTGVYPHPGARALDDADILIHSRDVGTAVRTLQEAGFTPWSPWEPGRETWLPSFTMSDAQAPQGLDVTVDLHWRIPYATYRSGSAATDAYLWRNADLEQGIPCAEAHLVLLAEHFVGHLRVVPHLIALADLVRFLPRVQDPLRLRNLAIERRALSPLRAVLWLLREELGVPLEGELARVLEVPDHPGTFRARALRLRRLLLVPQGRRETRVVGIVNQALLQGSLWDLMGELVQVLYPPREWLTRRWSSNNRGVVWQRLGYWYALAQWVAGRGRSPLSPNQEFEDPAGRR